MLTPKLDEFIVRMPKVELHIHLEGAVAPRTILHLAQRNGIDIPAHDVADIERLFKYRDFSDFLKVFMVLTQAIVQTDDFECLAYELGIMLSQQNVLYAEVMLSPMQHLLRGIKLYDAIVATSAGFARAEQKTGIKMRIALDYGRQYGPSYAWYVLEVAKETMDYGVVAWSIGGEEINYPPEPYEDVYAAAREAGLRLMAHAGEVAGPPSVWGAVNTLHAERLGHGIRSIDDPELVKHLRKRGVTLDICPSSNICAGAARSWEQHSLRQLFDAGVMVTINSDDPPFFETTLTDEYRRIIHHFGFTVDDLCTLVLNGVLASFLPQDEKQVLLRRMQQDLANLRAELQI